MRSFQDRLGRKHDKIRAKLTDNAISLAGSAVDCIRLKVRTNRNGDIESRTIISNDVVQVMFPPLVDVPMRRLKNEAGTFTLDSLSVQEMFPFELRISGVSDIERDDLLIRILKDTKSDQVYVMTLQIKDDLGTFGAASLIWSKCTAVYADEQLPPEIIEIIKNMAERRISLDY